ncbi:MAG: DUF3299 domain-containing protein [Micavibrio sp.]
MNRNKKKISGRTALKPLLILLAVGALLAPYLYNKIMRSGSMGESPLVTSETMESEQTFTLDDLLSNIDEFINLPEGGTPWQIFGQTEQQEYSYKDADGMDWGGVRPVFSDELKKLDGQEVLIQGYMFPLENEERQSLFLIGPFPLSCPYHYHVTPNLVIEAHAVRPMKFSYDPVNIKGKLELVPKDDEYNIFYRLKDARPAS